MTQDNAVTARNNVREATSECEYDPDHLYHDHREADELRAEVKRIETELRARDIALSMVVNERETWKASAQQAEAELMVLSSTNDHEIDPHTAIVPVTALVELRAEIERLRGEIKQRTNQ